MLNCVPNKADCMHILSSVLKFRVFMFFNKADSDDGSSFITCSSLSIKTGNTPGFYHILSGMFMSGEKELYNAAAYRVKLFSLK